MKLPDEFISYTKELMGESLFSLYMKGIDEEAPVSVRLNPFKCPHGVSLTDDVVSESVPWCPNTGKYLKRRANFTFDPLLHAGLYYVQEASSMLVDLVVRQYIQQPVTMLDLCAAPGGKSTALRAALPEGSLLFSNEPMRTRSQILSENLQKFGHPDIIVTNNYPKDYRMSKIQFDAILADVPCSGEGMFRKDEGAIKEWSTANVNNCWQLQRSIVEDIWDCLKPGGLLIYSTCTFNAHEDEENVYWIMENLGADLVSLPIEPSWNITGNLIGKDPMYHFIPGVSRGEGLFLAVLRKKGNCEISEKKNKCKTKTEKKERKGKNTSVIPTDWLAPDQEWEYLENEMGIYAMKSCWKQVWNQAYKSLKVIHAGIKMGTVKGKDLIPDQSLALSTQLHNQHFPTSDLSYADAVKYLRKEAVSLPVDTPKGYVIVTYRGIPLGWVKNLGNRANNLYPQEWKIKSSHIPDGDNNILIW